MLRLVSPRVPCLVIPILAGAMLLLAAMVPGRAQQSGSTPDSSKQAKKYERLTDPSLYVGAETCKTCHEDMPVKDFFKNYEASPHFVTTLDTKKGPEWHGCEACHGPGKAHVDGGGDKTKIFTFKTPRRRSSARGAWIAISMGKNTATSGVPRTSRIMSGARIATIPTTRKKVSS